MVFIDTKKNISVKRRKIFRITIKSCITVIVKPSIPKEEVVITDIEKQAYVINFLYLSKNKEDYDTHKELLNNYQINDPTELIMGDLRNFYPQLKQKIKKNWDRLFEKYTISNTRQGTIWQICKKDIVEIIEDGK